MVRKCKIFLKEIGYFLKRFCGVVVVCYFGAFLSFTILSPFINDKEVPKSIKGQAKTFTPSESNKIIILIISSLPRSGSTLLGEIISSYSETTKYYFEPDQYIEQNKCLASDSCTVKFFNDIFSCKEDINFHKWFKGKQMFFIYYNDVAKKCSKSGRYAKCVKEINLITDCKTSDVLLIKNIRTPLRVVKQLLKLHSGLKIIHLIRDPRGALNSIDKFKWKVTEETRCKGLLEDLIIFEKLKQKFPERIVRVSYEVFSLQPTKETKKLFKFLFDLDGIPEKAMKNLKTHVSPEKNIDGPMSTIKNSSSQYQSWRWKISKNYLEKVENIRDCRESILKMKHNLFHTISNTQNKNFSLFNEQNL
ncbi:UNVERIFIED_CONTAM: hypothetical protein RMT77_008016 [Armadillidium vulgare]